MKPRYIRNDKFTFSEQVFTEYPDVQDNNFKSHVNLVLDTIKNVFITGIPGAGKSTLINDIKKEMDIRKDFILCINTYKYISFTHWR